MPHLKKKSKPKEQDHRITLGELREKLRGFSDDFELTFGSTLEGTPLVFYRVKKRGPNLVQIELNELNEDFE